jgi:hypothetical protein
VTSITLWISDICLGGETREAHLKPVTSNGLSASLGTAASSSMLPETSTTQQRSIGALLGGVPLVPGSLGGWIVANTLEFPASAETVSRSVFTGPDA